MRFIQRRFLCACLGVLISALSAANVAADTLDRVVNVATLNGAVEVAEYGSYFVESETTWEDFDHRMELPELVALGQSGGFEPITTRRIGFGRDRTVIHVRIPLINPSDEPRSIILAFNMAAYSETAVNLVVEGEAMPDRPILSDDDRRQWRDRDILLHQEIEIPSNASAAIYVAIVSHAPMTLETVEHYEDRRYREEIVFHITLALIVGIALVTVTLMTALGHPSAFAYAGFLLAMCVYMYSFEQHLFRGSLTWLRQYSEAFVVSSVMLSLGFYLTYLRLFLRTKDGSRRLEKLLSWGAIIMFANAALIQITPYPYAIILEITTILAIVLSPAAGDEALQKGQRGSWPFLFGGLVLTASLLLKAVGGNSLSAHISHLETSGILHKAVFFEAIAFAIAMLLQVRGLRTERRDAVLAQIAATQKKLEM